VSRHDGDGDEATRISHSLSSLAALNETGPVSLVQIHGPNMGQLTDIGGEGATIGRGAEVQLQVVSDTVSRRHAQLSYLGDTLTVRDLGSLNGTYIDDERVVSPTPLSPGKILRVGGVIFKVLQGADIERRYHEEIYRMAIIDGLTNIHNKRYFMDFLEREHQRAVRHRRPLSLLIFDVDNFKRANDDHGHINGDRVLGELAARCRVFVRKDECFARYGGEEFGMILPETEVEGAGSLAEKVRLAVADAPFVLEDGGSLPITISVGFAALKGDDTVFGLIGRADRALYQAKSAGRNCARQG
jgi:two-component system cell cycle response regulator